MTPYKRIKFMARYSLPAILIFAIWCLILPSFQPNVSLFLYTPSSWRTVIIAALPIFIWITGRSLYICTKIIYAPPYSSAVKKLKNGIANSFIAGISEEIIFRFLIFFVSMYTLNAVNDLIINLTGIGVLEMLANNVLTPITNLMSFGLLHRYLDIWPWYTSAAIIISNTLFLIGHLNQKIIDYIAVWFMGLFLQLIMFSYGLIAAIVVHVVVDLIVTAIEFSGTIYRRMMHLAMKYRRKESFKPTIDY